MKNTHIPRSLAFLLILLLSAAWPLFAEEKSAPLWSYEGETGPEHWGELSPDFLMCSEGWNQSPINLVDDVHAGLPELQFEYYSNNINEINNGHSIQQNIEPGSFFEGSGKEPGFRPQTVSFSQPQRTHDRWQFLCHGDTFCPRRQGW